MKSVVAQVAHHAFIFHPSAFILALVRERTTRPTLSALGARREAGDLPSARAHGDAVGLQRIACGALEFSYRLIQVGLRAQLAAARVH